MRPRFPASLLPRLLPVLLFALCTLNFELNAQYFSLGNDPASVKWSQIKTAHFKVIYPDNLDSQALHVANALEYFRRPGAASLDVLPARWPVILHNRTVVSNAYTPYAPRRIEMVTTPPQDNYPQDWLDQLVIHEYRHAVQYTAVNRGLTKGLSYLFGQQVVAGVLGIFAPFWFIEGDAVVTETASTHTGRGRVPSFGMKLRAQFLEKGIYSYDKAYNGSYKDFTSNWYELGYLLVGHTRLEYGKETYSRALHRTGNIPLMLVPFSNTLYKETGYGKSRLYRHITSDLEQSWNKADEELSLSSYSPLLKSVDKFYTSRTQPAVLPDGRIIARKTSMDDITRIIIIDTTGQEKTLLTPGYMVDECLSASGHLLCWAELERDPRWELRDYSVIVIHDLQTRRTGKITHKTRYFSPDLSPDGKSIATIEVDENNQNFLVVLDAGNGDVIHRYPAPGNYFPCNPAWSPDGKKMAVTLTRNEGKGLAIVDSETGRFEIVMPFSNTEISRPCFYNEYILLTGSLTGIDNIFAFNTETKKLFQVTSSRFGAADASVSPDGSLMYYANYTADGYELVSALLQPESWKKQAPSEAYTFELAEKLAEQENFIFNSEDFPDSAFTIKPYRKGLNLFNLHSWAPLSLDIDNTNVNPGVTLLSQNLLGTSFATLGYEYDLNEETGKYFLKYSYTGLYPAFDLDMDYGLRRGIHQDSINYKFHQLNFGGWVRMPLNWHIKSWFVGLQPYAGYSILFRKMSPGEELKFKQDRFNSLNSRFYFYAQSRRSERDLNPRWSQALEFNYRQTLFEGDDPSSILATELSLYFPGFLRHHNFMFYGGYQERLIDQYDYFYSNLINLPKGYSGTYDNRIFSGSVSYEFPVFCPDWQIGPVLYLKRLKAAVFYDYAMAFDTEPDKSYRSTGLDLTFDFHLFRFFAPLEAGLRTIYLPEGNKVVFEFLYSMNLSY